MTKEALEALEHVKQYHPEVDTVLFLKDGRWLYLDSENEYFPSFADEIDASILEKAIDSVDDLPAIFQL